MKPASERKTLEHVLADFRGDAAVLRSNGHKVQADSMEAVCAGVAEVMAPYLDWLSEAEARSRSGKSIEWLRTRFPGWEELELARWSDGRPLRRQYRRVIIPVRANLDTARADARRAADRVA